MTKTSWDINMNRDNFEWEMNSTDTVARALILADRYTYEIRLDLLKSGDARWPEVFNMLTVDNNINTIVKLSINLLNYNSQYMKIAPDNIPILGQSEPALLRAIPRVVDSYNYLWGKSRYQLLVLSTDTPGRVNFLKKLSLQFSTIGLKQNLIINDKLNSEVNTITQKKTKYFTLINPSGVPIREEDASQTSDAFMDVVPADAGHNWKSDGEEINTQARKNLKAMGIEEKKKEVDIDKLNTQLLMTNNKLLDISDGNNKKDVIKKPKINLK